MIDASTYSIEIRKGNFEGELCFQARVKEIPYLEEYADTYEEAYALVIDSIEQTAMEMAAMNKAMPAPIESVEDYSGRVTLRLPKTLHAYLSKHADREEVSLNQLLVTALADFRGFDAAHISSRDWYMPDVAVYGSPKGHVERKISKHTNLKVVGAQHYVSAA